MNSMSKPDSFFYLNLMTKIDSFSYLLSFPVSRVDNRIDNVGHAKYVTKFDFLKLFWLIPLTDGAEEMRFQLLQLLMDCVNIKLCPLE